MVRMTTFYSACRDRTGLPPALCFLCMPCSESTPFSCPRPREFICTRSLGEKQVQRHPCCRGLGLSPQNSAWPREKAGSNGCRALNLHFQKQASSEKVPPNTLSPERGDVGDAAGRAWTAGLPQRSVDGKQESLLTENDRFFLNVLADAAGSLRMRECTLHSLHAFIRFLSFDATAPLGWKMDSIPPASVYQQSQRQAQRLRTGSLGRGAVISHSVCAGHDDG